MTDIDKARLITEWRGWRWLRLEYRNGNSSARLIPPTHPRFDCTDDSPEINDTFYDKGLPKYESLNDCHEFEKVIAKQGRWNKYQCCLIDIVCKKHPDLIEYNLIHRWLVEYLLRATPAQRVDAAVAMIKETRNGA